MCDKWMECTPPSCYHNTHTPQGPAAKRVEEEAAGEKEKRAISVCDGENMAASSFFFSFFFPLLLVDSHKSGHVRERLHKFVLL